METNEKRKSKDVLFIIIVVLLVAVLVGLIGLAYARYVTSRNGQAQAPIARWNFNVTAGSRQDLVIDLATTRNANDTDQVDRSTVAPGTSGVLQLNVTASGTETSLEYNINLNLSQVPPNLIFYYDQNMQNAIYKENNAINLTGFFDANNSNKTATRNLYWRWPLETGSTATEININDELDSVYMGRNITMAVVATGTQVMSNTANANQGVQVTFDANGGTIQGYGNSTQMTKSVVPGEQYGSLPIPTRAGYRFLGWHGRNLYDVNNITGGKGGTRWSNGVDVDSDDWITINTISSERWYNYWTNNLNIIEDRLYTIVVEISEATNLSGYFAITSNHSTANGTTTCQFVTNLIYPDELTNNSILIKKIMSNRDVMENFGLRTYYGNMNYNDNEKLVFRISVLDDQNISASTFRYEPYYITSTTEVAQNSNYTLTAIWQEAN